MTHASRTRIPDGTLLSSDGTLLSPNGNSLTGVDPMTRTPNDCLESLLDNIGPKNSTLHRALRLVAARLRRFRSRRASERSVTADLASGLQWLCDHPASFQLLSRRQRSNRQLEEVQMLYRESRAQRNYANSTTCGLGFFTTRELRRQGMKIGPNASTA